MSMYVYSVNETYSLFTDKVHILNTIYKMNLNTGLDALQAITL